MAAVVFHEQRFERDDGALPVYAAQRGVGPELRAGGGIVGADAIAAGEEQDAVDDQCSGAGDRRAPLLRELRDVAGAEGDPIGGRTVEVGHENPGRAVAWINPYRGLRKDAPALRQREGRDL